MPLTVRVPSASVASAIAERLEGFAYAHENNVTLRDTPRRGEPGIYEARNGELALATKGTTQAQRSFLADIFQGEFTRYDGKDALYFTMPSPVLHVPSYIVPSGTIEPTAPSEPALAALAQLEAIAPLLAEGHPLASSEEATALRDSDVLDQETTPAQLGKLITAIIRWDRFCEGTLAWAYESKLLLRIAQRTAKILHTT